jgi:signal transduction histidine kinase
LIQLVSIYLLFVVVVLIAGIGVNAVVEQRLRHDVEVSDQALAQQIALDTSAKLLSAEASLETLGSRAARTPNAMIETFQAFMAARSDVEHVYWLDALGIVRVSVKDTTATGQPPTSAPDDTTTETQFTPPRVVEQVVTETRAAPVFEVGIAQTSPAAVTPGVIVAYPVCANNSCEHGGLIGIVAMSLSLYGLSESLAPVVSDQRDQGRRVEISVIDAQGVLIATGENITAQRNPLMQTVLPTLPGADRALRGLPGSQVGGGPDGQAWLFSSVPVPQAGWAVVVQRPTSEALDVVAQFHLWLLAAALIFAVGVLVFWLLLMNRVIQPLHTLALRHQALPGASTPILIASPRLSEREDEVGGLARSLERLEQDVQAQLGELQTLLETSTAVVGSLDPRAVVGAIIREVRRLVDVQAAAVLVPDEHSVLRVLVSEGHTERYDQTLSLSPERVNSAAVLALRDGRPVQKILDPEQPAPALSAEEGFRAVLAIPIISRHVGGVVLVVHRTEPRPFSKNDVDLLLTFANYATLAWEHAVLYERSDERLREVAAENERLYRATHEEKQRLAAIMDSMSDGLVLAGADGRLLYANRGAASLTGVPTEALTAGAMADVHAALRVASASAEDYDRACARAEMGEQPSWIIETGGEASHRAIALRLFDVRNEAGRPIGRGLLLRDATLEREADEFKTTLLAAVGHELRTPLAAIKGHASTLLQEDVAWSPEDRNHSLRTISAEVDRLTGLVRDLLDLSRQQVGILPLHRKSWRLKDLLAGALQRLSQPPMKLEVDLPQDLPAVEVDRARIEVVLRNLLANAVAYGGTVVRVAARAHDDVMEVAVSDDGFGIAPEELPHLFERFHRAGQGVQRRSHGTGLGLAICKAFVEAHGGTIRAESSGAGTTIRFSLCTAQTSRTADAEAPAHAAM